MIDLLPQQIAAKNKTLPNKVGALFMKMGTGKTRVTIDLVNAVDNVDLVVWVGPLRTIEPKNKTIASIKDEIAKWGGFNCQNVIYIGIETIQASDRKYLQLYKQISTAWQCFLIVDESIKIKNFEAKRTKRLLELGAMADYKLILNGEPITRNLLDIWAQIQFLSPKILNMGIAEFKNTFCCYTTITKFYGNYARSYVKEFITGYENIDYLYSLINEYVFECDLELQVVQLFETVSYKIDEETLKEYAFLKAKYLDDEMLLMKYNNVFLEMTQKMQHLYSCEENKFLAVEEWFKLHPQEKCIIYCKYIDSREACVKRFPKATVLSYQQDSYGLNLQHLPYTILFDKIWDYALRKQAMARNFRTGAETNVRYLDLTGEVGLEALIDKNINKKIYMSEYFKSKTITEVKKEL